MTRRPAAWDDASLVDVVCPNTLSRPSTKNARSTAMNTRRAQTPCSRRGGFSDSPRLIPSGNDRVIADVFPEKRFSNWPHTALPRGGPLARALPHGENHQSILEYL